MDNRVRGWFDGGKAIVGRVQVIGLVLKAVSNGGEPMLKNVEKDKLKYYRRS